MNALGLFLLGLAVFWLGGRALARFVASFFGIDPRRPTPAVTRNDGIDYVPAKNWMVLFGHHFSSIAGAGPIIGPVIGVIYWGWLPAFIWVVCGTVLIGAVHDFVALMISVREGGVSLAEVAQTAIGARARRVFSVFVWLALMLVIAVFAVLCAKTFVAEPQIVLPSLGLIPVALLTGHLIYNAKVDLWAVTVLGLGCLVGLFFLGERFQEIFARIPVLLWIGILLGYAYVASVVPVNILLQPRDYLSGFLLVFGTLAGIIGLAVQRPSITQPAFVAFKTGQGWLWPMMCVTIACGAISGFHSLIASGTTSKQLASEAHAVRIGYGAMVAEGVVALLAIFAVAAGISRSGVEVCSLLADSGPVCVFGLGYAGLTKPVLGALGLSVAMVVLNAFILTTLDTATRVCRYVTEELTEVRQRFLSTAIVVFFASALAFTGAWDKIWPVFGASNQLVAALALFVASCWLLARGKPVLPTLVPAAFMLLTTLAALVLQTVLYARARNYLLVGITAALIGLAAIMADEVRRRMVFLLRRSR